jgi:hypothetical protein
MDSIEFTNKDFKAALDKVIADNLAGYRKAEAASKNGLKRTPFKNLLDTGRLNSDYMLDEAARIEAKASTLPAGERHLITNFVNAAALAALQTIQANTKQPIKKAKRQKKQKKA